MHLGDASFEQGNPMAKTKVAAAPNLVIVESPAKAKTIEKYLGQDFIVLASFGHVRDLIPKSGAVDPDARFAMHYEILERSQKYLAPIRQAAKRAETIYFATDPDREGEAISWHLFEILKQEGLLTGKSHFRVTFNEITEKAVKQAMAKPRALSMPLIQAQQARRALDYLVGFTLSPLLWKKVAPKLSAGRVQSPALRLIVEREQEIERFVSQEYWSLTALAVTEDKKISAILISYQQKKLGTLDIGTEATAKTMRQALLKACNKQLTVGSVKRKQRLRQPPPPFITSTLQQDAARAFGFSASRTMTLAQKLYEAGWITYMRTDATHLSEEALQRIRQFISQRYGAQALPKTANVYKTKAKNAQEAHEAIRPTEISREPAQLPGTVNADEAKLYNLIWQRTVACQMLPAQYDTVAVDFFSDKSLEQALGVFRATGSVLRFPGFLAVYVESSEELADEEQRLPDVQENQVLKLEDIVNKQHFTQPPPRFSEAALVKTLEEFGIGRPSTYAAIIETLVQREYVVKDKNRLLPTDKGRIVNRFLSEHFEKYVDYDFTAHLENDLDGIADGSQPWLQVLADFWQDFKQAIDEKSESVSRQEVNPARLLGVDPKSGKNVYAKMGNYGPYVQIGNKEDEEKPRFASLRPQQSIETISLEDALALFALPRLLGKTAEGEAIYADIGRFGPYLRYGSLFAALPKGEDPYLIELPRALEVIAEHERKQAARIKKTFPDSPIQVLSGRFSAYLFDGKKKIALPKSQDLESLTLAEAEAYFAAAAEKTGKSRRSKTAKADAVEKAPAAKPAKKTTAKTETGAAKKTAAKKSMTTAKSNAKTATKTAKSRQSEE
jgi:DNA topoisomerase-1